MSEQERLAGLEQYEWEDVEWTYEAAVDAPTFLKTLRAVTSIVDECRLRITSESVGITAVDVANVCAVDVETGCVRSSDGEVVIGVNLSELLDKAPQSFPRGSECGITIDNGDDPEIILSTPSGVYVEEAMNPEWVRKSPEWPELGPDYPGSDTWDNDLTLSAPKARGVFGALAETEADKIRITPSDGEILVEASNDGDVEYPWRLGAPVTAGESSVYTADYVSDIIDGMWTDGEIRVRFGDEQPLELTNGELRYALAPRIEA